VELTQFLLEKMLLLLLLYPLEHLEVQVTPARLIIQVPLEEAVGVVEEVVVALK
jgi:hypothetical protein